MLLHDAFGNTIHGRALTLGVESAGTLWYFAAKPAAICGACPELVEEIVAGFHTLSSFCRFKPSKQFTAQNC